MTPQTAGRPSVLAAVPTAVLLLCVTAMPAHGQVQSGNNGRALDANPAVGGSGNNLQNQVDYQARNNIVTGNVAGGFGFQGDRGGITAPGAFQGQLGSDDLFNYRAQSITSAPNVANLNTNGNINSRNITVYNSYTVPQRSTSVPGTQTRIAPEGGVFRVARGIGDNNPYGVTLNQRFEPPANTVNYSASNIGTVRVPDGSALSVTADPLLGVRSRAIPSATSVPTVDPTLPTEPGAPARQPDTYITPPSFNTAPILPQGPANNTEIAERLAKQNPTGQIAPTVVLGQMFSDTVSSNPQTMEQRVNRLQESIFGKPASTPTRPGEAATQTPENAYTKLLEEIRRKANQSAEERLAEDGRDVRPDIRPDWMKAMDEPTDEQVDQAESRLDEALRRIRTGQPADGTSTDPTAAADEAEAARAEAAAALEALLSDLDHDVRLDTLVADRETRVDELFKKAEADMAAGKFLNAERTYRQIRIDAPENPLGQSGLIHAQLGAGMVRSAAYNLRGLFESHPELIGTRYGENLLPSAERLEWLRGELQRMIDANSSSLDPGLMMAYLGYQVESRQLIRYGLAIAEEAAPLDPLIPVLRRIWLDQKSDETPAAQINAEPTPSKMPADPAMDK